MPKTIKLDLFNGDEKEYAPEAHTTHIQAILLELPFSLGLNLKERINDVIFATAPGTFSDALGTLEAYLSALDDSELLRFEEQLCIKAYVMHGWSDWRKTFSGV